MKNYDNNENKIIKQIDILNNSKEVKNFVDKIKNLVLENGAYYVFSRIKNKESAIDSYRTNKNKSKVDPDLYKTVILTSSNVTYSFKNVDSIVDLLGLRIVTLDIETIYKIVEILKEKYNFYLIADLVSDRHVGFEYRAVHMYSKVRVDNIDFEIPIEIQIKTYEMHHSWEGLHDTIYKNPNVNFDDGCTLLPILFKLFEYNCKVIREYLFNGKFEYNFTAIESIIKYNQPLFDKYKSDIEHACYLFAKSIYYDKNNKLNEKQLFNKFNNLKNSKKVNDCPLHICGYKNIEYATYCIATNQLSE